MELELFSCFGVVSCLQAVSCAPGPCTEVSPSGAGAEGLLDVEVTDVEDCNVEEAGVEEVGFDDGTVVVSWLAPQAVRAKGNAMRMDVARFMLLSFRRGFEVSWVLCLGICFIFYYFSGWLMAPKLWLNLGWCAVAKALMKP
ncbi:hypothetical protein [Corynebacterium propinquum]|uniref:hypothetical protein n=1 Tax=Corynebacterium propinquum TaxID=43769 RepID=UPI00254DB54B|nr:hypothetical protein [Corynebacterium propinquum]MDK8665745.1 hypothetical protein [Corynebacterium propinquum]